MDSGEVDALRHATAENSSAIMSLGVRLDRLERETALHLREVRDELGAARTEIRTLLHTLLGEVQRRADVDLAAERRLSSVRVEARTALVSRPAKAGAAAGAVGASLVELGARLADWWTR